MMKIKKLESKEWAAIGAVSEIVIRTFQRKEDAREFVEFRNRQREDQP